MNEELNNYVQTQLNAGVPAESIKKTLLETGWDQETIDSVLTSNQKIQQSQPQQQTPAQEPRVSMSQQSTLMPSHNSSSKSLMIGIIAGVIGLCLIGGGAWAYFKYFSKPKAETVISKMITSQKDITSFQTKTEIDLDIKIPDEALNEIKMALPIKSGKFKITSDAFYQIKDKQNNQAKIKIENEGTELFSSEQKLIDMILYYNIKNINVPILNMFVSPDKYTNKWITIDINKGKLQEELQNELDAPTQGLFDKNKQADLIKKFKTLGEKYENGQNLFIVKQVLNDEKINGIDSYHYLTNMNKTILKELSDDIVTILIDEKLFDGKDVKEIEETKLGFKTIIDKFQIPDMEMWIGKKDFRLYKFKTTLKKENIKAFEFASEFSDSDSIGIQTTYSNYNQPVSIDVPKDAIDLDTFMNSLNLDKIGGFPGQNEFPETAPISINSPSDIPQSELQTGNQNKDSDNDGLDDFSESYVWETDPNNPDTDGDTYKDGDEVKSGYNPKGEGKL